MAQKKLKSVSIKQLSKIQSEIKPDLKAPYLQLILDVANRNPDYLLHRAQEMLKESDLGTEAQKRVHLIRASQLLLIAVARIDLLMPNLGKEVPSIPETVTVTPEYYEEGEKNAIQVECVKVTDELNEILIRLDEAKLSGFAVELKISQVKSLLDPSRPVWNCDHLWIEKESDSRVIICKTCVASHLKSASLRNRALQSLAVPVDFQTRFKA